MNLIISVHYFLWLCSMVLDLPFYAWPISTALTMFFLISLLFWFKSSPRAKLNWKWIAFSVVMPVLILIYGTLHQAGENWKPQPYSEMAGSILLALLAIQMVIGVITIFRTPSGGRLLSLSILMWLFFISYSAAFIAGMSVTGVWL